LSALRGHPLSIVWRFCHASRPTSSTVKRVLAPPTNSQKDGSAKTDRRASCAARRGEDARGDPNVSSAGNFSILLSRGLRSFLRAERRSSKFPFLGCWSLALQRLGVAKARWARQFPATPVGRERRHLSDLGRVRFLAQRLLAQPTSGSGNEVNGEFRPLAAGTRQQSADEPQLLGHPLRLTT
jgi:hypothetical protein